MSTRPRRTQPRLASSPSRPTRRSAVTSVSKLRYTRLPGPGEGPAGSEQGTFSFESKIPQSSDVLENKELATDKLLFKLGYKLTEDESSFYHPAQLFHCANTPSAKSSFCEWRRGTIFRYPVATGTVDMIGSLYRPRCTNENCNWNDDPPRVLRLKLGKLHQLDLNDINLTSIPKRFSGRLAERSQNLPHSTATCIKLNSRMAIGGPEKKRKMETTESSEIATFASSDEQVIVPPTFHLSPPKPFAGTKKRKLSPEAEPSCSLSGVSTMIHNVQVAHGSVLDFKPTPETQTSFPINNTLEIETSTQHTQQSLVTGNIEDLPCTATVVREIVEKLELQARRFETYVSEGPKEG